MNKGQALITLLFFVVIAMSVTSAAVGMILISSQSGSDIESGFLAFQVARSGAENAKLRLLRDPTYTGETLTVDGGTSVIQVSQAGGIYTVTSTGTMGNFMKKFQMTLTYQ